MTLMDYLYALSMKYAVGQLKKNNSQIASIHPLHSTILARVCVCVCERRKISFIMPIYSPLSNI